MIMIIKTIMIMIIRAMIIRIIVVTVVIVIMTVIVMMIIMILVIIIVTTKIAKKTACLKTSTYAGLLLLQNLKIIEQMHCSKRSLKELQIYICKLFLCPPQKLAETQPTF